VVALVAQLWVHLDWIGRSGEHCDFPGECLRTWYPIAFAAAAWLWLGALVVGGLAWLLLVRSGASVRASVLLGVAWSAAYAAFFLTPAAVPTRHGVVDIERFGGGTPLVEGRYAAGVALLCLATVGFGAQAVASARTRATGSGAHRWTAAITVGVAVVLALGAAVVVVGQVQRQSVATRVSVSPSEEREFLRESLEVLDGHPGRSRSQLVSDAVLLREGVGACRWLATQPGGGASLDREQTRRAYFLARPHATPGWPFEDGRTALRRDLAFNAWTYLCSDVYADHVSFREASGD
jgi:hypothetical protein